MLSCNNSNVKSSTENNNTFAVSVILRVGPYIYSEFFRLTLPEIKNKFDSWIRNNHQILRISITFDEKEYLRVKDFEDLCWVVKHKDDYLFNIHKNYRLSD